LNNTGGIHPKLEREGYTPKNNIMKVLKGEAFKNY